MAATKQRDNNDLQGKVALVTGGTRGVGRATALRLAARGCAVAVNYSRSVAAGDELVAQIEAGGGRALAVKADVSDDQQVRSFVDQTVAAFDRLDYLVNNAGTTLFCDHRNLDGWSAEDFHRIMAVNALGPFQCARAAAPLLAAGDGGAIVNVGSIAGLRGVGSSIPYCMSKAALHNLTISLARALAPKVRVNGVAPGFIAGEWLQDGLGAAYATAKRNAEGRAALGKVCEPEDVADSIIALLTHNALVTGQVIPVEGGFFLA
ncbi:MAG: SDR family NAD(P)-dependent oxidoreductase, partial [Myxococcales bacterium]|nr:SDR family NAD(P)-dependent oxidoreductase [Myxococcales bacterium]